LARVGEPTTHRIGDVELVGLGLTQREMSSYYLGFCNQTLWPLFHCFSSRVSIDASHEECYRSVQARFAKAIRPLLRPGDLVWVHDYHFLLLGRELRRLGWTGRIGFFLHIPFPPHDLWKILPDPEGFLDAMQDYDLVGFHVPGFLDNYLYCCKRELPPACEGTLLRAGRAQRAGHYPIGIDPADFLPKACEPGKRRPRGELDRIVRGRRLILGVDRLDYTKGIPERFSAFEEFLRRSPEWRRKVSFIQIAAPSRTGVPQYREIKERVESVLGRVNAEMAEHDWVPLRYVHRTFSRERLAEFYREAAVGLVTPLRDGMNVVAMEFVASQRPESPGVLVLSRTAGAADLMPEAILVNPFLTTDVARGIQRALEMPIEERFERHKALLEHVLKGTAKEWSEKFLRDLSAGEGMEEPVLDAAPPRNP
jgi:trehalose 6-phosphate synthase